MLSKDNDDFLPLKGIDYIEFYVGNAKQAAHYYQTVFGFKVIAYAGLETGVRDKASYVLEQGNIRLVFTSTLNSYSYISSFILKHGDGVKVIAFEVDDAEQSFHDSFLRGAIPSRNTSTEEDEFGELKKSSIKIYGDTVHVFVERKNYEGIFAPGYQAWTSGNGLKDTGLVAIDHVVGNVELGKMNHWADFYKNVMGFKQIISFDDQDISTDYTALMSKVMANGRIKFPINEPAPGKKKSQIDEYLSFNNGPGVQHIALLTGDIIQTVTQLTERGIEFLYVPGDYYDTVQDRCGVIDEDLEILKKLGILVDRDDEGYLLQIFTKPVQDRPTLFYEIIQRKGARSFGKGNFKALFQAMEAEQSRRGNL